MHTPESKHEPTWNERYRRGKRHIGAYVDEELKRRIDVLSAESGYTITNIMVMALQDFLKGK